MKKLSYIFSLVLFIGTTLFVFEKDGYSVTRTSAKKTSKTSTKRAAVSSASTKRAGTARRAATSSSSTRRATTSSATTRRAVKARNARSVASTKTAATETETSNTNCPIDVVIKRTTDESGNEVFYSSKDTTCTQPENVTVSSDLNGLKLPTWIAGKNACVLNCNYGFTKANENGTEVCIDQNTICPLNITIQQKDDEYYNPYTNEVCKLPASSSALKLTEDTNMNETIASDEAYYTYCNKNHYKSSDIECKACPSGTYTMGAYIKYENITDEEGKITGKKARLIEGATSESDCLTLEELKTAQNNN